MKVKVVYVIPLLLFANMIFVMHLHTTYMGAIEELEKERKAMEDLKYHIQNTPDYEPLQQTLAEREVFTNWWGGSYLADPTASLLIGIPAVPRAQRYLTDTLASLVSQLPSSNPEYDTPWRDKIHIMVVNNKPDMEFEEFEELKQKYESIPELSFVNNDKKIDDRYKDQPEPDDFHNPDDIPGKKVRAQTYDLISLLRLAKEKSEYFLFMEDDFPICPSALDTFYYIIRKANIYQPDWKAVRSSYGMNGIFVRGSHVRELAAFLYENVAHRPPDGLAVEWMCGKLSPTAETCENPQRHLTFRWNLFKHIGTVSSLRETGLEKFPGCWAYYSHLLWEVDGFNLKECSEDDLWPCQFRPDTERLHKTLDLEGWPYINGYFKVQEQYGEIDVSLIQRPLRLVYSGPSPATRTTPNFFNSFLAVAFCMVVWKIMLWR